ncbi:MAG TPA: radical SAM protein, partial [Bacteroidota bacterium]|nr:radical SAM protein [Bacteroidota bacterium]
PHAYAVAARFRSLGKIVIGGGKFASTFPEEVQPHFDSILVGEAQEIWPRMVEDLVAGRLQARYDAPLNSSLENIPPPRYDLAERVYATPVVTEATRGCPHPCTYCQLNIRRAPHRTRPIADVIRDLTNTGGLPWHKRKMAMLLDNNLGGDLKYAKELLHEIARLRLWGLGAQFSIDALRDDAFVDALAAARCRMAFIGMESLEPASLADVQKKQNNVEEYREAFAKLHRLGILTFTGLMCALDEDTAAYYQKLPGLLDEVGTTVILPSIAIPLYGTPLYKKVVAEGRLEDTDLSHYEGDHLVFRHRHLSPEHIWNAYETVTTGFYTWRNILRRWWRFMRQQARTESLPQFAFRLFISTAIYLKLSIFQRHHAQIRIAGAHVST